MEHGGYGQPWAINHEHRPNGSMPNGYHHAISPSNTNGPLHHPQPPPPSAQQYAPPVTPYAQTSYMNDCSIAEQTSRKQVRATQACNHCRSRKQKCDEGRPCQFCRENNFDCQYKDVPPSKQDRSMMQLQESVNSISDVLSQFLDQFNGWKASVESRLPQTRNYKMMPNHASPETSSSAPPREHGTSRWPAPTQGSGEMGRVNSNLRMESPIAPHSNMMSSLGAQASASIKQESQFVPPPQQPATPTESERTDRSQTTEIIPKEQTGLQGDHTTPAHKLLDEWQQMSIFYQGIPYLRKLMDNGREVSDYPMQLEQDRGLLRVWGVGEGQDLNDGAQGPGSPESSNDSEAPSPAPGRECLWGYTFSEAPDGTRAPGNTPCDYHFPQQLRQENGLSADSRPDFTRKVMFELLRSYLETVHIFHPLMNETKLRRMFNEFSDQYSPDAKPLNTHSPTPVHGVKRKRSGSNLDGLPAGRGEIERSLRNAIVLLVLALGKVCSHVDPLPAPKNDRHANVHSEDRFIRDSPYPNGSVNSVNSDTFNEYRPKNIDLLPGMAYYAYATDILGNQQGGNTVAHAQAMLLAGLFLSQYARVLESWSWIDIACRIALVLIKPDYPKLLRVNSNKRYTWSSEERHRLNLVMIVYWTALQLESDILAEMSTLPPSGISAHQSEIMYPEGVNESWAQGPDRNLVQREVEVRAGPGQGLMMKLYTTQTFLRVVLNVAHNALYGPSGRMSFDPTSFKEVAHHALTHKEILEGWRKLLTPELAWSDDDYPSTDLNIARVRAKYYGGLYMMLRPYLKLASHTLEFPHPPPGTTGATDYILSEDQQNIIKIACQCINAAIRSTIAFDRVGEEPGSTYHYFQPTRKKRLIVTNIFGTLHAQFGNMLVLASVYKSKLYPLLPSDTWLTKTNLAALFKRTITVISEVAQNSPILRMDLEILENVQRQQGLE